MLFADVSELSPTHPRPRDPAELGFEAIVYEKAPPRATITLNRPDVLNAFDFRMLRELARACEDACWDDEIRVVVVTGTGRAFCVGADLRSWGADLLGKPHEYWKWFGAFKDMHDRLREIGKPTLARINGIAVGGGNELQMACDLAVMVDDAFIRHVGLEHGSVPAGGATQWLPVMVGDRRAREILLLCDEIPAAQAADWGLVNRAVPAAELDATVDELGGEASRASCRRRPATRSSSSTGGATSPGTRPSATRATGSRSRCSPTRRRTRSGASSTVDAPQTSRLGVVADLGADEPRRSGPDDHPQPAGGLQRVHRGAARRPCRGARRRPDPDVRAVVITGAGQGFCAGQDLRSSRSCRSPSRSGSSARTTRTSARSAASRSR